MTRQDNNGLDSAEALDFDRPRLEDGKAIHSLIERSPPLDLNSSYSYFLLCAHHADTCVVARQEECLAGFTSAYLLPQDPSTLFVWQVAVDSTRRGHGIAGRMLESLLHRPACAGVRYIETTISPSNLASRQLFTRFAQRHQADAHEGVFLNQQHFGNEQHEEERLIRIGPLSITHHD